jgi:outer membrane protein assembly factor BamE
MRFGYNRAPLGRSIELVADYITLPGTKAHTAMPMTRPIIRSLFMVFAIATSACSRLPTVGDMPLVYRMDIQQGNVITQEMLAQLRSGMNQRQVQFVMGTPLARNPFRDDRWDYTYRFDEKGEEIEFRRVSLIFRDGLLHGIEGNVTPALQPLVADARSQDKTVTVPPAPPTNLFGKIARLWSAEPRGTVVDPSTTTAAQNPAIPGQ